MARWTTKRGGRIYCDDHLKLLVSVTVVTAEMEAIARRVAAAMNVVEGIATETLELLPADVDGAVAQMIDRRGKQS